MDASSHRRTQLGQRARQRLLWYDAVAGWLCAFGTARWRRRRGAGVPRMLGWMVWLRHKCTAPLYANVAGELEWLGTRGHRRVPNVPAFALRMRTIRSALTTPCTHRCASLPERTRRTALLSCDSCRHSHRLIRALRPVSHCTYANRYFAAMSRRGDARRDWCVSADGGQGHAVGACARVLHVVDLGPRRQKYATEQQLNESHSVTPHPATLAPCAHQT